VAGPRSLELSRCGAVCLPALWTLLGSNSQYFACLLYHKSHCLLEKVFFVPNTVFAWCSQECSHKQCGGLQLHTFSTRKRHGVSFAEPSMPTQHTGKHTSASQHSVNSHCCPTGFYRCPMFLLSGSELNVFILARREAARGVGQWLGRCASNLGK